MRFYMQAPLDIRLGHLFDLEQLLDENPILFAGYQHLKHSPKQVADSIAIVIANETRRRVIAMLDERIEFVGEYFDSEIIRGKRKRRDIRTHLLWVIQRQVLGMPLSDIAGLAECDEKRVSAATAKVAKRIGLCLYSRKKPD